MKETITSCDRRPVCRWRVPQPNSALLPEVFVVRSSVCSAEVVGSNPNQAWNGWNVLSGGKSAAAVESRGDHTGHPRASWAWSMACLRAKKFLIFHHSVSFVMENCTIYQTSETSLCLGKCSKFNYCSSEELAGVSCWFGLIQFDSEIFGTDSWFSIIKI